MADDLRAYLEQLAHELSRSAAPGDATTLDEAVARARDAQARAIGAVTDEERARAWLDAWREIADALATWDDVRPRAPLSPVDTLPPLVASTPAWRVRLRRRIGAHYPVRSTASRALRGIRRVIFPRAAP